MPRDSSRSSNFPFPSLEVAARSGIRWFRTAFNFDDEGRRNETVNPQSTKRQMIDTSWTMISQCTSRTGREGDCNECAGQGGGAVMVVVWVTSAVRELNFHRTSRESVLVGLHTARNSPHAPQKKITSQTKSDSFSLDLLHNRSPISHLRCPIENTRPLATARFSTCPRSAPSTTEAELDLSLVTMPAFLLT